ncbi:MAG: DUF3040 domain-containing protein [Jatrophihabitantaceae bacterium]
MALSDYERRVLDQIESELTSARRQGRWSRLRTGARQCWRTLLIVVLGLLACAVAIVWAPTPAATVVGAVAGFVVGLRFERHVRLERLHR